MANVERPISPHLQIYKWQITSVLSIVHRATGGALGVGSLLLAWWLVATASGPHAFAIVQGFIASIIGRLILLGFSWALFYHLCNGIRHLFWDAGYGFDLPTAEKTGWAVVIASIALTVIAWILGYAVRG
jgi:succinate dehydrogenase / fumarate reductase cytochrome b subunit